MEYVLAGSSGALIVVGIVMLFCFRLIRRTSRRRVVVFLSYRVASDAKLVGVLYNRLRVEGLSVWLDRECLVDGKKWEDGFADGLFGSAIFVSVLSKDALEPFASLNADSGCDNVLLELRLATILQRGGHLRHIKPVLVGEAIDDLGNELGAGYSNFHHGGGVPSCPELSVANVEQKATEHLRRAGFQAPHGTRTVRQVLEGVLDHMMGELGSTGVGSGSS